MAEAFRDQAGMTLADYPRPSVAVDTALLTINVEHARLDVLVVRDDRHGSPHWSLPGTFLHEGERLVDAVKRSLRDKAGVEARHPRQLNVFDRPGRDDRGWVLSVAHTDVVPRASVADAAAREDVDLVDANRHRRLKWDHAEIIRLAVADVRERYRREPDPASVLQRTFTLRELRLVHEAVLGESIQRDNFRRAFIDTLTPTDDLRSEGRGRPAVVYRK